MSVILTGEEKVPQSRKDVLHRHRDAGVGLEKGSEVGARSVALRGEEQLRHLGGG